MKMNLSKCEYNLAFDPRSLLSAFSTKFSLLHLTLKWVCSSHQEPGAALGRPHKHGVYQAAAAELPAQHLQQAVTRRRASCCR